MKCFQTTVNTIIIKNASGSDISQKSGKTIIMLIGTVILKKCFYLTLTLNKTWKKSVLRIRIGFNEDPDTGTTPDPAFLSMRIRIQGFDDQKLEKIYS